MQSFSIEDLPQWFADYFGITLESGQAILSVVVLLAVLLPTLILSKGKNTPMITIILSFITMAFLVGIGWAPFWLMIASVALISLGVASLGRDAVLGG